MSVQCFCGSWDHEPFRHPTDPRIAVMSEYWDTPEVPDSRMDPKETTDPRIAALAEAMYAAINANRRWEDEAVETQAAAILAALRDKGLDIHHDEDWYAHTMSDAAEIDCLRKIKDAAREAVATKNVRLALDESDLRYAAAVNAETKAEDTLRAALEGNKG